MRRFEQLAAELERRFSDDDPGTWPESLFGELALDAFRVQYEAVPSFRALCDRQEKTPDTVGTWEEVPLVPARAFKQLDLSVAPPEVVFRTSGTTAGPDARGRHLVPRLSLYRASFAAPFRRHVMGDRGRLPFLSLIPSPDELPDSSLSFMVGAAAERFGLQTHWLVDREGVLSPDARPFLAGAAEAGEPVVVVGTALAFLHLVEVMAQDGAVSLPEGSRVMETGGFKGSGREVSREELYERISAALGVPTRLIVNEYGMTELLSQLYTPMSSDWDGSASDPPEHVAPPWLRVRALDPVSLEPLPDGQVGLLAFFDLANAGSVCHVLTEDVGSLDGRRLVLKGRVPGSEPRGCSRAMDELMSASRAAR